MADPVITPSTQATASSADDQLSRTVRNHLLFSLLLVTVVVGGIGGWMALTEISGAVVSSGTVVVESNIKQVQHREGGIVRVIKVKEGDLVEAGDLLISLDDT